MVHCTGGGQTKVLHFVNNLHIVKDNLFPVPHVFSEIREISGTSWKELYTVFNMGHRMELYVPRHAADTVIQTAARYNLAAQIIGYVEEGKGGSRVTVSGPHGTYVYTK